METKLIALIFILPFDDLLLLKSNKSWFITFENNKTDNKNEQFWQQSQLSQSSSYFHFNSISSKSGLSRHG